MVFSIISFAMTELMMSEYSGMEASTDGSTPLSFLMKQVSTFYRVVNGFSILLYGILLIGVHKKNPVYISPWLGFMFFSLKLSLIVDVAYSIRIVDYLGVYGVILIIMFVIKTAVGIVSLIVCYSYYRQLVDERASVSLLGVVHYAQVDSAEFDPTANNLVRKIVI